jgi:hypothetical protein
LNGFFWVFALCHAQSLPHSIQNELSFRMRPDLSGRNEESPGRNRIK